MKKFAENWRVTGAILDLFDGNTNVTTDTGMTGEMKTFYSKYLIDTAEPEMVHDQFAQRQPIPLNGGKNIEFRKYSALPKALTPITEGVTPDGQKLSMSTVTATVDQYGGFIELSDVLLLTAVDNNLMQATKALASQAGRTLDTVTREVLNGGTNVQFADGQVMSRADLAGGSDTPEDNHYLTVSAIRKAVRTLRVMNAPRINGDYVGIIHPDVAHDLMSDPDWKFPHQYVDTENIYENEIGKIAGVRFVETTEAKIWKKAAKDLSSGTAVAANRDVYSTLILGADAYGITEIEGGGLRHIVKQLGSAGTADPLNQRSTAGWKASMVAGRLGEVYRGRIETTSSFNDAPAN